MRVFLGIPLPEAVRTSLKVLQQAFQPPLRGIRWVRPDQIHVTLKFFGEITPQGIKPLVDCLRQTSRRQAALNLSLCEVGGFPSLILPRVLWVGPGEGAVQLAALAQTIEQECQVLGYAPEGRAYHPHVTLARIESLQASRQIGISAKQVSWSPPAQWKAACFTLYRSTINAEGPYYEALEEFAFNA